MKKLILTSMLAALVALLTTVRAQDYPDEYLGLPGDNLNLYAVMKLFQESETLEGFERALNNENSRINNLDLNGDNLIDYITVTDYPDGDDHTIVLRVALGRNDFQDIAVFTVQRFHNGSVHIQLIGDEALYGKNYIIEPIYEETPNPGYTGRPANRTYVTVVRTSPYEVAAWPVIRFIYMPGYMVWRSSWYWGYYPAWWSPWRPYYWHYYYGYHYNWYNHYYSYYHHSDHYRWSRYNDFYYHGVRAYSPTVVVNITKNVYKTTYSRPEQRSEGEALYTRSHPERPLRTTQARQPAGGNRQEAARNSASQRSEPANRPQNANREEARSSNRQSQPASREEARSNSRQSQASGRQEVTRPSEGQRTQAARKENPSASGRSDYKPAQSQSNRETKANTRSNSSSSGRSEYRPAQSQSSRETRAARSSGQTQRSSSGKSSKESKSSSSRSSDKDSKTRR